MASEQGRGLPTYVGLTAGVVAVSFAAILIRKADAPAIVIAAYRMGIAALVVAPTATVLGGWRSLPGPRDVLLCLTASVFLAVHFVGWIASLQYTSVASSVVLVTATPLMVALASRVFLKEPLRRGVLLGIALGLAGSIVIAAGDLASAGQDNLLGDALALLGAVAMTGYLLVGRRVRPRVSILPYLALVYVGAALLLLVGVGITRAPLSGYNGQTYLFLVLVALVPQVLGHSLLNWSLARVTATLVSIAVMAEPVVSTVLALVLLREAPPITSYAGGVVILTGIYLSTRRPRVSKRVSG